MSDPIAGLLYSQIGYDPRRPVRVVYRSSDPGAIAPGAPFRWTDPERGGEVSGVWSGFGGWCGSFWWVAEVKGVRREGDYRFESVDAAGHALTAEGVRVETDVLWRKTHEIVALDQLERRARLAKMKVGWMDAGMPWQEANSHAAMVLGLVDLLVQRGSMLSETSRDRLIRQIFNGCDYLALLQDEATKRGHGDGALSHMVPRYEDDILPADAAKAAAAWASAADALHATHPDKSREYTGRAARAMEWLTNTATPLGERGFSRGAHGVDDTHKVLTDWPTSDLLMRCRAALALDRCGESGMRDEAFRLADMVLARQAPQARADAHAGLFGHFFTFDGAGPTEKAWTHQIESTPIGADAGATFGHDLLPLIDLVERFGEHPEAARWRKALHQFAYGYLKPACRMSPFLITPVGEYGGRGVVWFAGLWHGMNAAYGLTAALASRLARLFDDPEFDAIADANLQWIAGLNAGLTPQAMRASHLFSMDIPAGVALPCSMIHGVGQRWAGGWTTIRGSICNGFSTGDQFKSDVEPASANDSPITFTDEDWITHTGAWLSGTSVAAGPPAVRRGADACAGDSR